MANVFDLAMLLLGVVGFFTMMSGVKKDGKFRFFLGYFMLSGALIVYLGNKIFYWFE